MTSFPDRAIVMCMVTTSPRGIFGPTGLRGATAGGVSLAVLLLVAACSGGSNAAEQQLRPFAEMVESSGETEMICSNGDAGQGISNLQPWSTRYFEVPKDPGVLAAMTDAVREQGFTVKPGYPQGLPPEVDMLQPDTATTARGDVLIATKGGSTFMATLFQDGKVSILCGIDEYGKQRDTGDRAILKLDMHLPDAAAPPGAPSS